MTHLFPKSFAAFVPGKVENMHDVERFITVNGPPYLLKALTTLKSHLNQASLSGMDATLAEIEAYFPKSRKGVHPRPDLRQPLDAYKKWRADLIRAVKIATGMKAAKQVRQAQQDGWTELLAAIKMHTEHGGLINPITISPVAKLADFARCASLEPWDLDLDDAFARLELEIHVKEDRRVIERAIKALITYDFIPEIARLLPKGPLPLPPTARQIAALPAHVEAVIIRMADTAASMRDEVAGEDSATVGTSTRNSYLAAMRHHLRALPHCPSAPEQDYTRPVQDLDNVNDVMTLFGLDHLKATIRRTHAVEHLPGTLSQASAYNYYGALLVVLRRNGITDPTLYAHIKTSKFLKDGGELAKGMRPATETWCRALATDPVRERRFRNLHRILMAKAEKIFDAARAEGRAPFDPTLGDLTPSELTKIRALGTTAAACAIEYAGRPIRMGNVLHLRLYGSTANFHVPSKHRTDYEFFLMASETKSGKAEPPAPLRKEMYGPQVLAWYLKNIRPLFPHADGNIHLFPSVEKPGQPLGKSTFDAWFQRAASEAEFPMTFHRWRHGYATLLLAQSWDNLKVAADMLGNTPEVCSRSYVWINKQKVYFTGQDRMIERARAMK